MSSGVVPHGLMDQIQNIAQAGDIGPSAAFGQGNLGVGNTHSGLFEYKDKLSRAFGDAAGHADTMQNLERQLLEMKMRAMMGGSHRASSSGFSKPTAPFQARPTGPNYYQQSKDRAFQREEAGKDAAAANKFKLDLFRQFFGGGIPSSTRELNTEQVVDVAGSKQKIPVRSTEKSTDGGELLRFLSQMFG